MMEITQSIHLRGSKIIIKSDVHLLSIRFLFYCKSSIIRSTTLQSLLPKEADGLLQYSKGCREKGYRIRG